MTCPMQLTARSPAGELCSETQDGVHHRNNPAAKLERSHLAQHQPYSTAYHSRHDLATCRAQMPPHLGTLVHREPAGRA